MSTLGYIAIVVGTLVFAWLFEKFFGLIFKQKIRSNDIRYLNVIDKKVYKYYKRQQRTQTLKSIYKALIKTKRE